MRNVYRVAARWPGIRFAPFVGWIAIFSLGRFSQLKDKPALFLPIAISVMLASIMIGIALRPSRASSLLRTVSGAGAALTIGVLVALPQNARSLLFSIPGALVVLSAILCSHVGAGILRGVKAFRQNRGGFRQGMERSLSEIVPERLAKVAAAELSILRFAFDWRMRPDVPQGAKAFGYHKHVQPMLWAFFVLVLLEIAVVHLLVSLWSMTAAWVLFVISDLSLLYLLGLINSLRKLPILVTDRGVIVRAGILIEQFIPIENIKEITRSFDSDYVNSRQVLRTTLMAYPNLLIELKTPLAVSRPFGRRQNVSGIGVHPDDPVAFSDEVCRVKARPTTPV